MPPRCFLHWLSFTTDKRANGGSIGRTFVHAATAGGDPGARTFESFGCDFGTASEIVTVGVATGREQGLYRANAEAQAKAAAEATDEHDPRAAEDKS